jgi:hypothetical protein
MRAARRYSAANFVLCRSRPFRKAGVVLVGIEC